jgi:hypothetical protein
VLGKLNFELHCEPVRALWLRIRDAGAGPLIFPTAGLLPSVPVRYERPGCGASNLAFSLEGFPHRPKGRWGGIGNVAEIQRVVDAWLDTGKLPAPYVNAAP